MTDAILGAFYSLSGKTNKVRGTDQSETEEGVVGDKLPELTLDEDNESIGKAALKWEKNWKESKVYQDWFLKGTENENYWIGKQFDTPIVDKQRTDVDNALFEALETFLPSATSRNPDPVVELVEKQDQKNDEAQAFATELRDRLSYFADELKLRLKLKKGTRHWAIYLLGAVKMTWDFQRNLPVPKVVRPQKLILDPDATVDEDGYTGDILGEYRKLPASELIDVLKDYGEPGAVKLIEELAGTDLATEIGFIEWWKNTSMYWTLDGKTLLKKKNMHWNYSQMVPVMQQQQEEQAPEQQPGMPALPQVSALQQPEQAPAPAAPAAGGMEQDGQPSAGASEDAPEAMPDAQEGPEAEPKPEMQEQAGINHLAAPKMPYFLLSIFNLGKQPVDDTSLMGQNLANQDRLNKRNKQVDKNADSMNNGMVVSLERSGLTKEQSKGVTDALRKGGVVTIPAGSVNEAMSRMSAPELPATIYTQIVDTRNRIKDIFGTRGTDAAGLASEKTASGKVQLRNVDSDRIGGGVSEYLEQLADDIFNYAVQMIYVYDPKYADGQAKPKVSVSVKSGSMLPKDSASLASQAVSLGNSGKMALVDIYTALEYANPKELAANVWLEANAPELLYGDDPRVQQAMQMKQQAAQAAAQGKQAGDEKGPSQSINFKDLPPEGKAQMAAKVGIQLHPEGIAAHDEVVNERGKSNAAPVAAAPAGQ